MGWRPWRYRGPQLGVGRGGVRGRVGCRGVGQGGEGGPRRGAGCWWGWGRRLCVYITTSEYPTKYICVLKVTLRLRRYIPEKMWFETGL
jgi:hypothetical protein